LVAGTKLPPQAELAPDLGVSLLTLRQALNRLEQEGLIASEQGRGTFVRSVEPPLVVILEKDDLQRMLLASHVEQAGFQVVTAANVEAGLVLLLEKPNVMVVLSDIRVPLPGQGLAFIRTVRRRWPRLPLVAVTGHPEDLAPLYGTPDHPVLILTKTVVAAQIREVLRYVTAATHTRVPV
jgi:DNA-binding transcriptional regulator YhcF (GntR family)